MKNGGSFHGKMLVHQRVYPIFIPLNHHFPMVFLWFSYGFPMVFVMSSSLHSPVQHRRQLKPCTSWTASLYPTVLFPNNLANC